MKAKLFVMTLLVTSAAIAQDAPPVADLMPNVEQESVVDKGGFAVSLMGGFSRHYFTHNSQANITGQSYGMRLIDLPGTVVGGEFSYAPQRSANSYKFEYRKATSEYSEIPKASSRSTQRFDETYKFQLQTKRWGLEKNWGWLFGIRRDLRSYTTTTARVGQQNVVPLTSNMETGISLGVKNQGRVFGSFKREFVFETFLPIFVAESPSSGSEQYILNVEMVNSLIYPFADSFEASLGFGIFYDRAVFSGTSGVVGPNGTTERNLRDAIDETIGIWIPVKLTYNF